MRSSSEEGSYLRLVDFCITQLLAESDKEEEREVLCFHRDDEAGVLAQVYCFVRCHV
jgi:hypothetical protein